MRIINTRTHGYMDYLVGVALILAPWIFGFFDGGAASWIPIILGIGTIIYSLMTDYELGAGKAISMKGHLTIDVIAGVFLALSPWLFGFADYVFWPHLIVGILEIGAGLMTETVPRYHHRHVV